MKTLRERFRKFEFENRIFFSLGLVLIVCLLALLGFPDAPSNLEWLGRKAGLSPTAATRTGYFFVAGIMVLASLLRMWSGTVLSSPRVMSFKIQKEVLNREGPYRLTRNPIYLADFCCFICFGLSFPLVGLLMPLAIYFHYRQLILYEEGQLAAQFGGQWTEFARETPRFFPSFRSLRHLPQALKEFRINWDGFRHNGQYVLLVPGFIVTAYTGNMLHAILIGLPGVLDWAIVHTVIGLHPERAARKKKPSRLLKADVFQDIIYAQCWEDPAMDREAFRTGPSDVLFSITSGGCNTLAFLVDDPARIYALDMSPYQNHLLELKMAAFRRLDYPGLLAFLGVTPSGNRQIVYKLLAGDLSEAARTFWDGEPAKIELGIIHAGRYERYMHMLRRVLVFLIGRKPLEAVFDCETREARQKLYDEKWNNLRWRIFTKVFLSRAMMSLLFTKEFFRQLKNRFSFGDHFRERVRKAVVDIPARDNYFLAYILHGGYPDRNNLPVYLQPGNFEKIRNRLDRIEIVTGDCTTLFRRLPPGSVSRFNFSNIFEWMDAGQFAAILEDTIRVARNGAVLTYRNLLVPRSRPDALAEKIRPDDALADRLHARDRSFVYRAYHVEYIIKRHDLPDPARQGRGRLEGIS